MNLCFGRGDGEPRNGRGPGDGEYMNIRPGRGEGDVMT
jgi:hypothetical protein